MQRDKSYMPPIGLTPWGLPASFFQQFQLSTVPAAQVENPPVPSRKEAIARFEAANPDFLREHFSYSHEDADFQRMLQNDSWLNIARGLPFERLLRAFSLEELLRFWWQDAIMSELSEEIYNNPRYMLFSKIKLSFWHWGYVKNWNLYVKWFYLLQNFNFGLDDFAVYIDFASWHNEYGYMQYSREYCDGAFCFNITYKQQYVLRIGFSPCKAGCLITQIQPTSKKGNRWMFKLPCHYFDYCLERLQQAFSTVRLWLVTGDSMATCVERSYQGQNVLPRPEQAVLDRIAALYDRPLTYFHRTKQVYQRQRRVLVRLQKKGRKHEPKQAPGQEATTTQAQSQEIAAVNTLAAYA